MPVTIYNGQGSIRAQLAGRDRELRCVAAEAVRRESPCQLRVGATSVELVNESVDVGMDVRVCLAWRFSCRLLLAGLRAWGRTGSNPIR